MCIEARDSLVGKKTFTERTFRITEKELPCSEKKERVYYVFVYILRREKKSCVSFMFGFFYFKNLKVKTIKYIKNSKSD